MISKLATKYDKKIYRFFEIVPGVLTWLLFLSPIWLGILAPRIIIYYISFLTIYWTYLALKHSYGIIVGYKRYQDELATDWMAKFNELDFSVLPEKSTLPKTKEDLKYFLLIPVVNEPYNVLKESLDSILEQTYPLKNVKLIYALEEKYAKEIRLRVEGLIEPHKDKFSEVLYYVHPAGIPGEAIGVAGANRTWGAKQAVGHLRANNESIRDFIFYTIDSDHVLHEHFLARVAYMYLTTDRRDNYYYSTAVNLFNNNLWEVPVLSRIEANAVTLGSLSDWVVSPSMLKESFSNYAASLQTLIDADYWDVERGIDDTLFFWRAFFARDGDFSGKEHYIPYSADAVSSKNTYSTYKSMYLQLRRWGYGAIAVPVSFTGFLKNKKVHLSKKLLWVYAHLKRKVFMLSIVFLMTFGISLVTLVNQDARQISLIYSLPRIMSVILTFALIFLIPVTLFRNKIASPPPQNWSFLRKASTILEGPMVIVNLFTFSLIPFIDAQTRMVFGKRMKDLYHTPKVR